MREDLSNRSPSPADLTAELRDLFESLPHKIVEAEPRRPFREPGAPSDELLFVRDGILSKYKNDGSGRRQIVALRFTGEVILPRPGRAAYGVQAIVSSQLLVAGEADFNALLAKRPELASLFWTLAQRNEAIGYEWLVNCGRRDSTARVAHLLLETAVRKGADSEDPRVTNPFTQQQIADITGQTSVNVNRVFADLERQGLIERTGREILFKDWEELRRVASFQPSYLS
jgi:CRP-like cAMP-binding protein